MPAFAMSRYKVTNGEYLDFVRDGADAALFLGHSARASGSSAPCSGPCRCRSTWPVYVTQQQAAAYARWKGKAASHRSAIPSRGG